MRVGIVGIGWWSDVLAKVVARSDKLELRAGFSRSPEKTARFAEEFACEAMPSYEAMLALDDLDAVILTTPNSAHRPGTEAAAAAGKHVFVEKPIANSIADGKAMIAACEAAGVTLAVGHSYRRSGALRHLKAMIDDGELGRVSLAEGNFSNDNGLKLKPGAWRTDPAEIPGGCLMQIGIHQVDNLLYLLGEPVSVTAAQARLETEPEIPDTTALLMRFASGSIGYVGSDYISPRRFTLALHGTRGNAFFNLDRNEIRVQRTGEAEAMPVAFEAADHLLAEMEDFADAVADNRKPEIDGTDALVPLTVVLAAVEASSAGREVLLSELLGEG